LLRVDALEAAAHSSKTSSFGGFFKSATARLRFFLSSASVFGGALSLYPNGIFGALQ
jgi:hypothetical protein